MVVCHHKGPRQDGEMGWPGLHETQQVRVLDLAPREEEPRAPAHAGGLPTGEQPDRKWPRNPDGHLADHEPAVCPSSKEDQKPRWLPQAEHYNRSTEVTLSVLSTSGTHLGGVASAGLLGTRETRICWGESTEEPLRWWRACSLNSEAGTFCTQEEQA